MSSACWISLSRLDRISLRSRTTRSGWGATQPRYELAKRAMRILPRTARRRGFGFDPLEDRRLLNGGYFPDAGSYGHPFGVDAHVLQSADGFGRGAGINRPDVSSPIAIPPWPGDSGGWINGGAEDMGSGARGGGTGTTSLPEPIGGPMPLASPSLGDGLQNEYGGPTLADLQPGATPAGVPQGVSSQPTSPSPTSGAAATTAPSGSPGGWPLNPQGGSIPGGSPAVQPAIDAPGFQQGVPADGGAPGLFAEVLSVPNGSGWSPSLSLASFLDAVFAANHAWSENLDGVNLPGGSVAGASAPNAIGLPTASSQTGPLALTATATNVVVAGLSASIALPGPPAQPAGSAAADLGHTAHLSGSPALSAAGRSHSDGRASLEPSHQGGAPGHTELTTIQAHTGMLPAAGTVPTAATPDEAPPSPLGADLIVEAFPFSGHTLERSLDAFVRQLEEVDVAGLVARSPAPIFVTSLSVLGTGAAAIVASEMLQRRSRRGRRLRVVDSTGRELALSFPELPRSWSQRR